MINYNEDYQSKLHSAWENFIACAPYDFSVVRPEVLASWDRSRSAGVDPLLIKSLVLSESDINRRLECNSRMIKIVRSYMERIHSIVKDSGFYLMLCDREGIILDIMGDENVIDEGRSNSNLVVGANRSESFAGTNAIGTCLTLGKPIQICGEEHYVLPHKKYTCSSSPIFTADGALTACLTFVGLGTAGHHIHTLSMILCAADGISNEMKIRSAYATIESISAQRNTILDSTSSGFILLDENDVMIQSNRIARKMLGIADGREGDNFFDMFSINDASKNVFRFSELKGPTFNKETNFYARNSGMPPIKLIMSVNFTETEGSKNTIVRLEESGQVHRLVNKIGGFRAFYTFDSIVGNSAALRQALDMSRRAAMSTSNILILGESGVGKELFAQSIHNGGENAKGPFVPLNCGALPKGLIESELFGYEGGAFTGANKDGNPGKFELANGGTLFLDEIGDMPLDVQASLLRVIQTREIIRIGARYSKRIDVRIIAATHRDLYESVINKTFREDLYYRLNVLIVSIPPLRERVSDVAELAESFLHSVSAHKSQSMRFAPEVYPFLESYAWPGNVRELENAVERAVNVADGRVIGPEHLPPHILNSATSPAAEFHDIRDPRRMRFPAVKPRPHGRDLIVSSLRENGGNVKKTAEILGVSRRTLYRKIDKYSIDCSDFRETK
ncbi:MAG: sigma-54-dependent Fis family transcriptional regulator [Clostridiales Family XIII bacterium]|nr:sigma-54-dependent Fis family transcriptional regulator [Clostridiales Family XIII bacterium]